MRQSNLARRDFHKLTIAALGGLAAGAGCVQAQDEKQQLAQGEKQQLAQGEKQQKKEGELTMDPAFLAQEPHVCRGLNTCEGKGKGEENACAGQGACATVGKHSCEGMNECKGQGGCSGYPGQNTCNGKGHCAVPLSADTWKVARKQFEEVMKDLGHKVGAAPKQ